MFCSSCSFRKKREMLGCALDPGLHMLGCRSVVVPKDPTWKVWTAHSILNCSILQGIATLVLPVHYHSIQCSPASETIVACVQEAAPRDQTADLKM